MKKRLSKISPLQSAKTLAVLYFLISLPMLLIMVPVMLLVPGEHQPVGIMVVVLPLLYAVGGFIGTLIAAWLYNLAASWTGGIEITVSEQR
ncbi:hypothetical protein [Vogesella sp. LIG4]|uniref:hypothetical protein n=1 Tax=Vogesella sp. LIG4 TaxID=1192162 RepID=UPI0008201D4C|nr:hypothetical protein [Vogesella sp. LIG4]SCK15999.1 hypothetical protein PSELUDRAFT_1604 [Vogesella sp. LIG4]